MREIKFRAWIKKAKKMVPVTEILFDFNKKNIFRCTPKFGFDDAEDSYAVLMQFTGLLDKNGKEICEGDIVEWVTWNEYFSKDGEPMEPFRRKMIVVFRNGAFQMKEKLPIPLTPNYWDIFYDGDIEIIGNVYENPELLEEEN